jgi:hypothetical protein
MTALISRDELRSAIDAGTVTVVDALGGDYYAQQHLPGALALVEDRVAEDAAALLPDRHAAIVTYCSNPSCPNSHAVATRLAASATPMSADTAKASRTGSRPAFPWSPSPASPAPSEPVSVWAGQRLGRSAQRVRHGDAAR